MFYAFPPDLRKLIDERLTSRRYANHEEVLRDALRALAEEDEDLVAVRKAVAEWRPGDKAALLVEAIDELNRRHQADGSNPSH